MGTRLQRILGTTLALAVLISACAPSTPGMLQSEAAVELVRAQFPDSDVRLREVARGAERTDLVTTLDGVETRFRLEIVAGRWSLVGIEQDGVYRTIADLQAIASTMGLMRRLAAALGAYSVAVGGYPEGRDAAALETLVPKYHDSGKLVDAWGNGLAYRLQGEEYTLTSLGTDGRAGTEDDIILVDARFITPR